jgi:hypothetical protein
VVLTDCPGQALREYFHAHCGLPSSLESQAVEENVEPLLGFFQRSNNFLMSKSYGSAKMAAWGLDGGFHQEMETYQRQNYAVG